MVDYFKHWNIGTATKFGLNLSRRLMRSYFDYGGFSRKDIILEIGPGRGFFADICLRSGIEYIAIEPNAISAKALRKKDVKVYEQLVPPLGSLSDFTAVVMIASFEHLNGSKEAWDLAKEIYSRLPKGGKLLLAVPDIHYLGFSNFYKDDFSHNYITSYRRIKTLLMSIGFDSIKIRYQCLSCTGIKGFLVGWIFRYLPFAWLKGEFPENYIINKLRKLQLCFSRFVVALAVK